MMDNVIPKRYIVVITAKRPKGFVKKKTPAELLNTKGGLAIWRGDKYILSLLFANRLQFQLTDNAEQFCISLK